MGLFNKLKEPIFLCILCCIITFSVGCEMTGQHGFEYSITEAYQYPVVPGME